MSEYQAVAVILAAGSARRMNAGINKVWLPINGRSILDYVLQVFGKSPLINHLVLVVNSLEMKDFQAFIERNKPELQEKISLVIGGSERQDSVSNSLQFLKNWPGWSSLPKLVIIHDAARALLSSELLQRAIEAGLIYGAVGTAVPVKDTIKRTDPDGFVTETPERSNLWAVQTPQAFDFDLITACYERISGQGLKFTDDCSVVEYCGHCVKIVLGSYENFKVTTPEDLILAETIVRRNMGADRSGI